MKFFTKYFTACKFYGEPLALILAVNVLVYLFFGCYFEGYEGLISALVHGTYTQHAVHDWDFDIHFLQLPLYAMVNRHFDNIQVHGIVMVVYNWLALTLFGLVLFRILKLNLKRYHFLLFVLLYAIASVDSIINLSLNRIIIYSIFSILAFVESRRWEGKEINLLGWGLIAISVFYISMIKGEVAALSCFIFIGLSIALGKFNKYQLLPLGIAIFVSAGYLFYLNNYSSEAKQVYFYKEFDFMDRNNVAYEKLTALEKREVALMRDYQMVDKQHLTFDFYDHISKEKHSVVQSLLSGVNKDNYLHTLSVARPNFNIAKRFILFCLIMGVLLLISLPVGRIKWMIWIILILLFPITICLYLAIPVNFLIPYYLIMGVFFVLKSIYVDTNQTLLIGLLAVCLLLILNQEYFDVKKHKQNQKAFQEVTAKLAELEDIYKKPIVINNTMYASYMPANPLGSLERRESLFLNFYFLEAAECYQDNWAARCSCDPFSLKEKLDYVVKNQLIYIVNEEDFNFMAQYMSEKYGLVMRKEDIGDFNERLKICKLTLL